MRIIKTHAAPLPQVAAFFYVEELLIMLSDYDLSDVLFESRTIAVVGMSDKPARDSYAVACYLKRNGYQVIPVNPNLTKPVFGLQPCPGLRAIPVPVDIVSVFRRSAFVSEIVTDAIAIGAKAIWTQLGVIDQEAARRAQAAGLKVVMDRCIAVEHRRLSRYALAAA
jgi:predicted CoA-binding protein